MLGFKKSEVRRPRIKVEEDSPPVTNYAYSSRNSAERQAGKRKPLGSEQPKKPNRQNGQHYVLQRLIVTIILIGCFAALINFLILSSTVKVVILNKPNEQTYLQPSQVYATEANKLLKGSVWNRTKITVEASKVATDVANKYPELSGVSLTVQPFSHTPILYIDGAIPGLILTNPTGSFIVDDEGRVLAKITAGSQIPTTIPTVTDESGLVLSVKGAALPSSTVVYIKTVTLELGAKGYQVSNMVLPAESSSELDVHLSGQPYYIKFNLEDTDPAGEAGTFLALMKSLKSQNITPTQYVDVRIPGRAYYL